MIGLLAGTMRRGRGRIAAVEDNMRQTYTVKHIRKGLTLLSSEGSDPFELLHVPAYTVKLIRKGLTLLTTLLTYEHANNQDGIVDSGQIHFLHH